MKKIARLTENDLIRLVKKIIYENNNSKIEKKLKIGLLFEIGDASAKVYKYKFVDTGSKNLSSTYDGVEARFKSDSGIEYVLLITNMDMFADVDFSVNGEYPITNRGEVFRVMATISTILQKVINENPWLKGIRYVAQDKGNDLGKGRDNLYRAFIESATKKMGIDVKFLEKGEMVFVLFT